MGLHSDQLEQVVKDRGLRFVGIRGDVLGPVCFVGEAPGANEEAEGKPFVGASGKELQRMAEEAGIDLGTSWFTNAYKVRPPSNQVWRVSELGIDNSLFQNALYEEIEQYKPTIIIACGATALKFLCPGTTSKKDGEVKITQWTGSLLRSDRFGWDHYVVPMPHPAYILREWSDRPVAVFCLARAAEELAYYRSHGKLQPLPERKILAEPSADDVLTFLHDADNSPRPVAGDIETFRRNQNDTGFPYTMGLAVDSKYAVSFSLWDYPLPKLTRIWRSLDKILSTHKLIGQNWVTFDLPHLENIGFSPSPFLVDDTLVRHHTLWPEFPHKLQFQTFQYTREPYYKDEGKFWNPKHGKKGLMVYNAKDCLVDYEIWERQEEELDERGLRQFYNDHAMRLTAHLHRVSQHGYMTDAAKLDALRKHIQQELGKACVEVSKIIGKPTVPNSEMAKKLEKTLGKKVFNIGSPAQLKTELKLLGMELPKNHDGNETANEESLNKLFAKNGHPVLKQTITIRELNKIKGTYVEARLKDGVLYTQYVSTGTLSGRRASRETVFGYGTNLQNIPIRSELGRKYRECIVARPGKIFVMCDQVQAEDWVVQGLIADISGDRRGLDELLRGVDRHRRLACFIFSLPDNKYDDKGWKDSAERFIGKKTRHAGNYDMEAQRFSEVMANEGHHVSKQHCEYMLGKFHEYDPGIKGVFHRYVVDQLSSSRTLVTPFGRERIFFGLRPFNDNKKIFKEAYSYIPQSAVGDNTGKAIIYVEEKAPEIFGYHILQGDTHDSLNTEVNDDNDTILKTIKLLHDSFDRRLVFPNGLSFTIPIEVEIGYSLADKKKIAEFRYENPVGTGATSCQDILASPGLVNTLDTFRERRKAQSSTISGAQLLSSQPVSSATSGSTA
jgi:uracil-DNA glycosylase family 4